MIPLHEPPPHLSLGYFGPPAIGDHPGGPLLEQGTNPSLSYIGGGGGIAGAPPYRLARNGGMPTGVSSIVRPRPWRSAVGLRPRGLGIGTAGG